MTQVDSSEVLFHLNNYGIKYIEKDAFERFVRGDFLCLLISFSYFCLF